MYLFIYNDNWADEFDFQCWELSEEDWLTPLKEKCEKYDYLLSQNFTYCIGTNEEVETSVGEVLRRIKVIEGITTEQSLVLKHLKTFSKIPKGYIYEVLESYETEIS